VAANQTATAAANQTATARANQTASAAAATAAAANQTATAAANQTGTARANQTATSAAATAAAANQTATAAANQTGTARANLTATAAAVNQTATAIANQTATAAANLTATAVAANPLPCQSSGSVYDTGISPVASTASPPYWWGVQAVITSRVPRLCVGGASWSYSAAYVKLAGSVSGDFAEVGFERSAGDDGGHYFALDSDHQGGQNSYKNGADIGDGQTHTFTVKYLLNPNVAVMYMDGSAVLTSSFDPAAYWGTPWTYQFEARTHDWNDDVPGIPGSVTYFNNLGYMTCNGCGFSGTAGLGYQNPQPSRYRVVQDSNTEFHVYTYQN